jgi:putative addiction module component (TIGR02574 family)
LALRRLELLAARGYVPSMPLTVDQLAVEAMQLPPASRAELAEKLVESLDFAESDEIQKLWVQEAIRRRDEVRSGKVKPIPGEEVLADVRRSVGR